MLHARLTYVFLCFVIAASAQEKPKKKTYFVLKAGSSFLFNASKKGQEQVSFPYSVVPTGGSPRDSSFASHPFDPLKSVQTTINFSIEIGNSGHFFEFSAGGFTSANAGSFMALGYGRNFYVSLFGKHSEDPIQRDFVFTPSFHIGYNAYNNTIGSLDNQNKNIFIGSYTSGPTFTESDADIDNSTSTTTTYTTQTLTIAYLQRSCVLTPQVAFGNNQYKHIFHWEIVAGAYFSAADAVGVKFTQEATDGNTHQSSNFYTIGTNSLSAVFNGNNVTRAPIRFSGFKIGFDIGISAGPLKKYKAK
jgi:hypothetical protein